MPIFHQAVRSSGAAVFALASWASAGTELPDPQPDPYASIGTAAVLTPTRAVAGAAARRAIGADGMAYAYGAILVWPRVPSGEPLGAPTIVAPPNGLRGERFGAALAPLGTSLAVGSPGYGTLSGQQARGRIRVLGDSLVVAATIDPPQPMSSLEFGSSVAGATDRLLVGAPGWRLAGAGEFFGAAYLFAQDPRTLAWTLARSITAPTVSGTRFGAAVAITSDMLAVGAPGGGATAELDHGRVWLFSRADEALPPLEITAPQVQTDDRFGSSLASAGDLVIVGAPGCACEHGRAFVGRVGPDGWTPLATLAPPDEPGWSGFGSSVAIIGPRIAVGTGGIASDGDDLGHRLAIYRRTGDAWEFEGAVEAPSADPACGVAALDAAGVFTSLPLGGPLHTGAMRYDALDRSPDVDGNGAVGAGDLGVLLGAWGPTQGVSAADLNGDGFVGADDLAIVLGGWTR